MLKNIKSKLATPINGGAKDEEATERKRRKKQKEREALASVLASQDDGQAIKLATKSLGSKKLATVVNRIKLMTGSGRSKRWSLLKFGANKHELEARQFELASETAYEKSVSVECGDGDSLSFYSALDCFVEAHEAMDRCASTNQSARATSESDANYRGYLQDDKYILPEEQCDIPTFLHTKNCDQSLIDETRRLLRERHATNPDSFYDHDYERMLNDDWTVTRFLLRRRLDPKRTAKLMEECGKFRKEYLMSEIQLCEFPREFHLAGGLFRYLPDRVGNQTLYMRVKMYRRVPEISDVFKAFILCALEQCDVANGGRGTAVIFDLTDAGLQNVDLAFLYWLLNSFRNYCPKGVSYILVYNLPWFLSTTCKLAMTWLSETNRRSLRFVSRDEIKNFIASENLPDYLGGTCAQNYRKVPRGSRSAIDVCERLDITPAQALKIRELFKEYLRDEDEEQDELQEMADDKSVYGDVHASSVHGRRSVGSSNASTALMGDSFNLNSS